MVLRLHSMKSPLFKKKCLLQKKKFIQMFFFSTYYCTFWNLYLRFHVFGIYIKLKLQQLEIDFHKKEFVQTQRTKKPV